MRTLLTRPHQDAQQRRPGTVTSARCRVASATCRPTLRSISTLVSRLLHGAVIVLAGLVVGCDRRNPRDGLLGLAEVDSALTFLHVGEIRHEFDYISDVEVGPTGQVFVASRGKGAVYAFDTDGVLFAVVSSGRDGDDEFRAVTDLEVVGDSLYVFDAVRDRITVFGGVTDKRIEPGRVIVLDDPGRYASRSILVESDGSILIHASAMQAVDERLYNDSTSVHRIRGSVTSFGEVVLRYPPDDVLFSVVGTGSVLEQMPFGRKSLLRLGGDGQLIQLWTGKPQLSVFDSDGTLLYQVPVSLGIRARPVTQDDMEILRESIVGSGADLLARLRAERLDHALREERLPREWPFVTTFIVDGDRVWLSLVSPHDQLVHTRFGYVTQIVEGVRSVMMVDLEAGTLRQGSLTVSGDVVAVHGPHLYVAHPGSYATEGIVILRVDEVAK